jgi:hypothetical protein
VAPPPESDWERKLRQADEILQTMEGTASGGKGEQTVAFPPGALGLGLTTRADWKVAGVERRPGFFATAVDRFNKLPSGATSPAEASGRIR